MSILALTRYGTTVGAHSLVRGGALLLSMLFAASLDQLVPIEASLGAMYALPIILAVVAFGRNAAIAVALIAGGCSALLEAHRAPVDLLHAHLFVPRAAIFAVVAWIAARWRSSHERLHFESRHDPLTGLLNRRAFESAAASVVESANRYGRVLSIAFLDLDHFKQWNDSLGHAEGDRLLAKMGEHLLCTRKFDFAARLGGDEFVLLMPETNSHGAQLVVTRLRALLGQHSPKEGMRPSFSAGIVTFARPPADVAEVVRMADAAMYNAKHQSKGTTFTVELPAGAALSSRPAPFSSSASPAL